MVICSPVARYQYFQDEPGELIIKILPKKSFNLENQQKIQSVYQDKVGNELKVEVQVVDDIPLTNSGKA